MPAADSKSGPPCAHSNAGAFVNTHWSVVLSAADPRDSSEAMNSLEKLCRAYWLPLYSFVRRQGESPHDAQDLTQAFFARLIEKDYLRSAHPDRGRFRSFLLAALKHFLSNERDKVRSKRRGGDQVFIAIDIQDAETHYGFEPVEHLTPQKIFERRWASALLQRTMLRLRNEYTSRGKAALFEELKGTLIETRGSAPYAALAARLYLSEAAVKMAVHRLRQRYRQALRAEVAETVASPDEVEDELREVFRVFSE
jgi:DNA-directed RNA polymerase specialized sigma24 family protein